MLEVNQLSHFRTLVGIAVTFSVYRETMSEFAKSFRAEVLQWVTRVDVVTCQLTHSAWMRYVESHDAELPLLVLQYLELVGCIQGCPVVFGGGRGNTVINIFSSTFCALFDRFFPGPKINGSLSIKCRYSQRGCLKHTLIETLSMFTRQRSRQDSVRDLANWLRKSVNVCVPLRRTNAVLRLDHRNFIGIICRRPGHPTA